MSLHGIDGDSKRTWEPDLRGSPCDRVARVDEGNRLPSVDQVGHVSDGEAGRVLGHVVNHDI